jgi:acetylornithine deacetylase/succinyl-diaminopimelate desuccinylase-like protein
MTGTRALAEADCFGADMVLIGEPTDFDIGTAHTGIIEMELETKGYAGHPSHIGLGFKYANAVVSMNKIINVLFEMQKTEPIFDVNHPKLGKGAIPYIGPIVGGFKSVGDPLRPVGMGRGRQGIAYMCPEWCKLRIGVRTLPGQENTDEIVGVIRKHLERAQKDDPSVEVELRVYLDRNLPVEIPDDSPAVDVLRRCIGKVLNKEAKLMGNVYCTDFPPIFEVPRGIPGAWTGPGLARYLRPDEHVTLKELVDTVKVFTAAALDVCGVAG